ncbi:RICIN domain-containing protein [Spirosoma flavum]|uniref:RICIN domain-containing protein n=1 Tax=Spirosoma flavum TaxID=2048557 RepID=A0ABW6AJ62_9BACT
MKKLLYYWLGLALMLSGQSTSGQTTQGQAIQGTYAIKNVQTGMLLRVKDAQKQDGTPIVLYTPTNWKCMTWDFHHLSGNAYQLKNLFTSKTLQPATGSATIGEKVAQQPIHPNQLDQQWEFVPIANHTYLIKLANSDLYLTPADSSGEINSGVILSPKQPTTRQQWTLYEQHPTF